MAQPNYAFAKRQKEIAKKLKKEAKKNQKTETKQPLAKEDGLPQPPADETTEA